MAVWQLCNCMSFAFALVSYQCCIYGVYIDLAFCVWVESGYLLLGLISSLVFRAIRDALPHDPAAQERILGASLLALAIADVGLCLYVLPLVSDINSVFFLYLIGQVTQ